MMHNRARGALAAFTASLFLAAALPVHASDYPSKPVSIIVGYPAGGSVDLTARLLGEQLSTHLGQTVVIENVGGAGGTIGAQRVARAAADGYTLLLGSTNEMLIAGMINTSVRYDAMTDFTPVGMIASQPLVLVASSTAGVASADAYVKKLKAGQPGDFNFGSSGIGTALHLAGEMINESAKIKAAHVPYRGVSPMITDLAGGQLDFGILVLSSAMPHIKAGKLVALGTTEKQRSPAARNIPALSETAGLGNVDINVWFGLYGPSALPAGVQATLRAALTKALASDVLREKLAASGATLFPAGTDPVQFHTSESGKFARLVKLAGIKPAQ